MFFKKALRGNEPEQNLSLSVGSALIGPSDEDLRVEGLNSSGLTDECSSWEIHNLCLLKDKSLPSSRVLTRTQADASSDLAALITRPAQRSSSSQSRCE